MTFFAHSPADGSDVPQSLAEHSSGVATKAAARGAPLGIAEAAHLAGLLHDAGKYDPRFQRRLAGALERVEHSTAGAALVASFAAGAADRAMADLLAYAIAGHHAGLPDRFGPGDPATLEHRLAAFDRTALDPAWEAELGPLHRAEPFGGRLEAIARSTTDERDRAFRLALLGRMTFSCLVDADFEDTEAFYGAVSRADRTWPALDERLDGMIDAVRRRTDGLASRGRPIDALRAKILAHVRERAALPPGLFTLTVPTGGGKTLASLAFALDHARAHGLRRIIYAIPFTSVVDQTAAELRALFGDLVLEHHSAIETERDGGDDDGGRKKLRLATEDWAAPVVVTTHVQLFESLFAARPGRCRKLHAIAGSVVVLDEAQTLPRHLLAPTVRTIDALARDWGVSIVLCTATQPAFDQRHVAAGSPLALDLDGRELAPDPTALAAAMRRVTLRFAGDMADDALVAALGDRAQALAIVNSRGHALALYRAVRAAGLAGALHLTTRQVAAHRRKILDEIRRRLRPEVGEPCRVIATSLVEAGIDLDFPAVFRAEAGLDQIAQAAGRCNREGLRPVEDSLVTVFSAPDNPPPREIEGYAEDLLRIAGKYPDLLAPEALTAYFREVFWRLDDRLDARGILDRFQASAAGSRFEYRTAARDYRMIEEGMVPVVVPYDDVARAAVDALGVAAIPSGALARRLQPYLVQVPPKARTRLLVCGRAAFAHPDLRGDQFAVLTDGTLYDPEVGLLWEDADYLASEQLMA